MKNFPLSNGTLHFVGIGGIGMSGMAEILTNLGCTVQGSDLRENANTHHLRKLGVGIKIGHKATHVQGAMVVVVSSAIPADNPEIDAARAQSIPVISRAEMLAELMRLKWSIAVGGTHGKTTSTSMIAALLEAAGHDPTVINGGIINAYGSNARLGTGEWMVAEADESDGTFCKLPATIAVVTNIDPEHLDFYGNFACLRAAFQAFVETIPFYGFACLCIDHPEVETLAGAVPGRRIVTYGLSPQASVRGVNVETKDGDTLFDVEVGARDGKKARSLKGFCLPMAGHHNIQNALAALSIGLEMDIDDDILRHSLARFKGVKRRFTRVGTIAGITVIDDYAHHPVEIAATLQAARSLTQGKLIAVLQPHRYSRVAALFDQFCTCLDEADTVIVSPIYAAGEDPIAGIDRDSLIAGLRAQGHREVLALDHPDDLASLIANVAAPTSMVVCMGAGTITQWANDLLQGLATQLPLKAVS